MAIATDPLLNIMVPKTNRHPLEVAPWHHLLATHVVGFSVSVGNAWTPPNLCFCWAILFRNQQARISIFWKKKKTFTKQATKPQFPLFPLPPQKKNTSPSKKKSPLAAFLSSKIHQNYTNTPHSPQRIAGLPRYLHNHPYHVLATKDTPQWSWR